MKIPLFGKKEVEPAEQEIPVGEEIPVEVVPEKPKKSWKPAGLFGIVPEKQPVVQYDPAVHGSLVEAKVPDGFQAVDQYWIQEGRSLVYIALNDKTGQNEYLLFEPHVSEFEYELLERLHEDLRDILILTDEEMGKDRTEVLMDKMMELLKDYCLKL